MSATIPEQPKKVPIKPKTENPKIKEMLRQKEEQKTALRKKMFEAFGFGAKEEKARSQSEQPKESKAEFKEAIEQKNKRITSKTIKPKIKKSREEIFKQLKEIVTESKKKKYSKIKNAK